MLYQTTLLNLTATVEALATETKQKVMLLGAMWGGGITVLIKDGGHVASELDAAVSLRDVVFRSVGSM
jgi:dienelactone hydrolase